jgi:hypothetical protein
MDSSRDGELGKPAAAVRASLLRVSVANLAVPAAVVAASHSLFWHPVPATLLVLGVTGHVLVTGRALARLRGSSMVWSPLMLRRLTWRLVAADAAIYAGLVTAVIGVLRP